METTIIQIAQIPVWRLEAFDGPEQAQPAFYKLTQLLGPLAEGRDCYGLARHEEGRLRYWACFNRKSNDPIVKGAEMFNIPAGKYIITKLDNWQQRIPEIGKTFTQLAAASSPRPDAYGVEYYCGRAVELWLAVK